MFSHLSWKSVFSYGKRVLETSSFLCPRRQRVGRNRQMLSFIHLLITIIYPSYRELHILSYVYTWSWLLKCTFATFPDKDHYKYNCGASSLKKEDDSIILGSYKSFYCYFKWYVLELHSIIYSLFEIRKLISLNKCYLLLKNISFG